MALKFNIKLVMYGEPYVEYGSTPLKDAKAPSLDLRYFVNDLKDIYLGGLHYKELKDKYDFKDNDLLPFMPIRSNEIINKELKVEYLGWYVNWDPQKSFLLCI